MKKDTEKKEPSRGAKLYSLISKHGPTNDLNGFVEEYKTMFGVKAVSLERVKSSYMDFLNENPSKPFVPFAALSGSITKHPVMWSIKGMTISKNLVDQSLYQQAIEGKTEYRITMYEDLRVECLPIKK